MIDLSGKEKSVLGIPYKTKFCDDEKNALKSALEWKKNLDANNTWEQNYPCGTKPIILLISKGDLIDPENKLDYDDFCKQNGFHSWMVISSKTGEGVELACDRMLDICKKSVNVKELKPSINNYDCVGLSWNHENKSSSIDNESSISKEKESINVGLPESKSSFF